MPPGDLPVTIAHVANVTRSAASRGGTSAPSASVTASWVSTFDAAATVDCDGAAPAATHEACDGTGAADPDGSVGGGGIGAPPDWVSGSACGSGAGAAIVVGLAPLSTVACSLASSAAPSGWPADASFSSSSATVLAPPRSSACAAAISSALLPFWSSAIRSTSSRCSIA